MDKLKLQVLLDMADRVSAPLKRIGSGARTLGRDLDEAQKALRGLERQQAAVARYRGMQEGLRETKARLDAARTAQQGLVAELKKGGDAAKAVGAQYRASNDAVNKLTQAYARQLEQTRRLRQGLAGMGITNAAADEKRLAEAVDQTTKAIERKRAAQARLERLEASTKKGAALGAGMAAGGAAGMYAGQRTIQLATSPLGAFMQHEDAMLGIARQVKGARDENGKLTEVYREAEKQVRALSERLPQSSVQIAEMMTAAARMEVPTAELGNFVELTSEMADAFDAVPDQIAESMGKIANNLKIPITEIRGMADAINYLDDNAISKGGDIIGFLNRVGGVSGSVKISGAAMAALGSTLLTSGETEETAGTSVKAILTDFAAATRGTKSFKGAVHDIGMTPENLQAGMADDAVATLLKVAEAIKKLPKAEQLGVMADLVGKEHVGRHSKLVNNTEELHRQLALVNGEDAKGSMAREAAARKMTASAQLIMQQNRMFNAMAIAGETLKDPMLEFFNAVNPMLKTFTAWMQENSKLVGWGLKAAIVLGVLMAAAGAILIPIGLLIAKTALLRFAMARLGISFGGMAITSRVASASMGLLTRAATLLSAGWRMALPYVFALGRGLLMMGRFLMATPLGLALSLLATAATMWYTRWNEIKGGAIALWTDLVALKDQFFQAGADLITGLANGVTSRLAALRDTVVGVADEVAATFKETLGINSPSRVFMEYGGWISEGAAIGMQKGQHLAAAAAVGLAATTAAPMAVAADSALAQPAAAIGMQKGRQLESAAAAGLAATSAPSMAMAGGSALARPTGPATAAPAAASTYQITIHASQGMDGQAIAQAVRAEIERMEAAKRRRVNSQMSDME